MMLDFFNVAGGYAANRTARREGNKPHKLASDSVQIKVIFRGGNLYLHNAALLHEQSATI